MPGGVSRGSDGKQYSVFVAGASDCDQLRDAALEIFANYDEPAQKKFLVFDWRKNTSAGHMRGRFQESIFEDAKAFWGKDTCDIFLLILWHTFGEDTKREYDFYVEKQSDGDIKRLFVCFYNEPVYPRDLAEAQIDKLFEWVNEVQADWAEISTERGSVERAADFYNALSRRLIEFLREPSEE